MIKNKIKRLLILSVILIFSVGFTGCQIPFDKLLGVETNTVQEKTIEGIDVDENESLSTYVPYQKNIISIFKTIGNQDFYLKNFNNIEEFYYPIQTYLTSDYLEGIKSETKDNILKKTMDNIYYLDNTEFKEARIVGLGKSKEYTKIDVEIIAIDDTTSFQLQTISIYINSEGLIDNIEMISDIHSSTNTTKGIDKDSLIDGVNSSFSTAFTEFIKPFKNKNIYNLSQSINDTQSFEYEINTLIDNLEMKNQDKDVLISLFKAGKATFSNYGIVEYMHYDKDAEPTSIYTVEFSYNGELLDFNFYFNRLTKEIYKVNF